MSTVSASSLPIIVMGAGLAGCIAALELARSERDVLLVDRLPRPMLGASRHNEGKLHLGYVYAADPQEKTHKVMASGSLRFLDIIERLTGIPHALHLRSDPFTYIVPEDTALSVENLACHVRRVDETVAELSGSFGLPKLPTSQPVPSRLLSNHYSKRVTAAFATPEIAVDPARVSDLIAAAIYAHPNIRFLGSCDILDASCAQDGHYRIDAEVEAQRISLEAFGVINALWEDRVRLDETVGLARPAEWSQRWKATITIDVPKGQVTLPSSTAFVGPYGDFVLYGDRRIYVSWYPVCRLSMSTTASPAQVREKIAEADHEKLRREAIEGLATLIPGVADLDRYAKKTLVGGGFIMALGTQDIDQSDSGLHERHQIGIVPNGNWVSISTGKFCTAPAFGVEGAQALLEALS